MRSAIYRLLTAVIVCAVIQSESLFAQKIYWSDKDAGTIHQANLDGTDISTVVDSLSKPGDLGFDEDAGQLYWTSSEAHTIHRSNHNGSELVQLFSQVDSDSVTGVVIDEASQSLYWIDRAQGSVRRSDLLGRYVQTTLATGLDDPVGLALDPVARQLYWTNMGARKIQRCDYEGANVVDVITGLHAPSGIAIDSDRHMIYWCDSGTDWVQRADIQTRHVENLVRAVHGFPQGIAVDTEARRLFWTDAGTVWRADLDGTDATCIVDSGLSTLRGLALNLARGELYWTDSGADRVQRARLDGTKVEDLFVDTSGWSTPWGIAVYSGGGKLYWSDYASGTIRRSNLNGGTAETVIAPNGAPEPESIAIDASAGTVYWTDNFDVDQIFRGQVEGPLSANSLFALAPDETVKGIVVSAEERNVYWGGSTGIHRSDLDMLTAEPVMTQPGIFPQSLALDPVGEKIYWGDSFARKLQRCNLDGTQVEDLLTRVMDDPEGIAIDELAGQVYWADSAMGLIRRSDLNGQNVVDLISSGNEPHAVALDVDTGHLYWAERATNSIYRSNLDGTDPAVFRELFSNASVCDLRFDGVSRYLYIADCIGGTIRRIHADNGQDVIIVNTYNHTTPMGIVVDPIDGKVYWIDESRVRRANLDGSSSESVVNRVRFPVRLALDSACNMLAWYDGTGIVRSDLDVKAATWLQSAFAGGVGLDCNARKIYWSDRTAHLIRRMNFDGTDVEDIVTTGLANVSDLSFDTISGKLYWADLGTDKIQRANLDGSNIEDLVTTGLLDVTSLDLDPVAGKLYWTDATNHTIQKSNLDGTNVEVVISGRTIGPTNMTMDPSRDVMFWIEYRALHRARRDGTDEIVLLDFASPDLTRNLFDLAVDRSTAKLYWSESGDVEFHRCDYDLSNCEDLFWGSFVAPTGLALDHATRTLYWLDAALDDIFAASIDTSSVSRLHMEGLQSPVDVVFDSVQRKLYWTDTEAERISRSAVDVPSRDDVLVRALGIPNDVALDTSQGKLYWADGATHEIRRADLDGHNVESVISGIADPAGIIVVQRILGDCDNDGEVGIHDFGWHVACMAGPNAAPNPACNCTNLNQDETVDLADLARLQVLFTGR